MADGWKMCFLAALVALSVGESQQSAADEYESPASFDDEADESLYYQQPAYRPNPRAIVHQKAQARAQQRQDRLAHLNWFGMTSGRTTAAATPFTTYYIPARQMPGAWPFVWQTRCWPAYAYVR
jgi:hypothetical protein